MAISDKVIELETKKKGRTALFIVLIALLAAASAAFAVLWVIKAPAVDPPAVERIVISGGDLCQSGTTQDSQPMYKVAPSCKYSVVFDMEIKAGFSAQDVNALINVTSEPSKEALVNAKINSVKVMQAEEGVFERDIYRCELEFTVNKDAKNDFDIIVTSEYSKDVGLRLPCKVDTASYAEHFDVVSRDGVRVLYESNNSKNFVSLVKDPAKSSDTLTYLKVDEENQLVYYVPGNSGAKGNVNYRLDLEQLGALGENGQYAKVYNGGDQKLDIIKVEAGAGSDWESAQYTEMTESFWRTDYLNFRDLSYCHNGVEFKAEGANNGNLSFIKLTANTKRDGAPELVIVLELEFVSSDTLDKITEIVVTDPYTGEAFGKDDPAVINLYRGKLVDASDLAFTLSDCISVKRGGEIVKPSWDTDGLTGTVSSPDGLFTKDNTEHGVVLKLTSIDKTGSCKVQVRDTDPRGFKAYKDITVNLLAHIENVSIGGKTAHIIDTTSDKENTFNLDFTLAQNVKFADVKNSLNAQFSVIYPEGFAPPAANATAAQRDKTFVIDGLKNSAITPALTAGQAANAFKGGVKIKVGKSIASGQYDFKFVLASQGFKDHKNGVYTPLERKEITVTLNVTHIAGSVGIAPEFAKLFSNGLPTGSDFECDKYTVVESNDYSESKPYDALLTIGVGTGKDGYTAFAIKDMVAFYTKNDKGEDVRVTAEGDITVNLGELGVNSTPALSQSGAVSERKFVVPSEYKADVYDVRLSLGDDTCVIRVEYKMPVTGVSVDKTTGAREYYYDRPDEKGVLCNNGDKDIITIKSFNNEIESASQVKSPQLLNFDIAVLRGDTAKILLPKRQIDNDWYYFLPNIDFTELDKDSSKAEEYKSKAVFRMGYPNILSGHNVTILRDLYELTYIANKVEAAAASNDDYIMPQIDFQRVYFYYSYGTKAESNNEINADNPQGNVILTNERTVVSWIDERFVAFTEWNFVRNLDGVKIYEDNGYENELTEEISVWADAEFNIYYSGIINISDGKKIIIEKYKTALESYRCGKVTFAAGGDANIKHKGGNIFTATCAVTETKSGTVTFTYDKKTYTAVANITVSNTSVKVHSIEFYLTNPVDTEGNPVSGAKPLTENEIWLVIGGHKNITFYYKVTYEERKDTDKAFEVFSFGHDDNFTANITPTVDLPPNFAVDPSTKNPVHVRCGAIVLDLAANAQARDYKFWIANAANTVKAEKTVRVTSPISAAALGATYTDENDAPHKITASQNSGVSGITVAEINYLFNAAQGANNAYDFEFTFGNADKRNLAYSFANTVNGITATFNGESIDCAGYRITLTNKSISRGLLTVKITETYKEYNAATHAFKEKTVTYYIHSYINVDVPVTDLTLTMQTGTESAKTYNNGDSVTFTADGVSGKVSYNLGAIINNGDTDRVPANPAFKFVLANAGAENAFALSGNGNILTVDLNVLKPQSATLSLTAGNKTISITLSTQTNKRLIKFKDDKWNSAFAIADNNAVTVLAGIYDAGNPSNEITGEDARIEYSVNILGGSLTVTQTENKGTFTLSGAYGLFTVTATYTYGNETVSVTSGVITVSVPLGDITVKQGENEIDYNSEFTVVSGQTAAFKAYLPYTVPALGNVTSGITVTSSDISVAVATVDNSGNITVRALKSGNANVSVSYGDKTPKVIKIRVTDGPELVISANKTAINAFDSSAVLTVTAAQASGYDMTVSVPTVSGNNSGLFAVARVGDGNEYTVTLDKSKTAEITAALQNNTQFAISTTATVQNLGNAVLVSNTVYFTLTASGYEPTISLELNGSTAASNKLDKKNLGNYKFKVSSPEGFTPSVVFSSEALDINNDTDSGKVIGFKAGYNSASGTVNATVTVLGKTYTASYGFEFTEEHGNITSELYYSSDSVTSVQELITENGEVDTSKLSSANGGVNIDSPKFITVVVEYTNAPSAVLGATKDNFSIAASANVTALDNGDIVKKNNKYFYVAQFSANKTGEAVFTAYTSAIGGVAYSAQPARAIITATEAGFALSTAHVSLEPGASKTVIVSKNASFRGNVTYEWQFSDSKNIVTGSVADTATNNDAYTLTANYNVTDSVSATLTLKATVTDGAYDGVYTLSVPVTVDRYDAPAISVKQSTVWLKKGESQNLNELLAVSRDSRDTNLTYKVTFTVGGEEIENGIYVADATENVPLSYSYEITGGYFKGRTGSANEDINIIVAPDISWTHEGDYSITQIQTADLGVTVSHGATLASVTYVLDNPAAGIIADGIFTPSRDFTGTVKVTAIATVNYAGATGAAIAIEKQITVSAKPEPQLVLNGTDNSGFEENAEKTGGTLKFELCGGYSADYAFSTVGNGLALNSNGTYTYIKGKTEQTVKVIITAVIKGGEGNKPYEGTVLKAEVSITVPADSKPELTDGALTLGVNSGAGTAANAQITGKLNLTVASGMAFMRYECNSELLAIDNAGNCVIKPAATDTEVSITVHYVIISGAYAGTVESKEFVVTVRGLGGAGKPELNEASKTIAFAPAGYTVSYSVTSGGEYIELTAKEGGYSYEFKPQANGKEIKVTFTATVSSGVYAGYNTTVTLDIPTPPVVVPTEYTLTLAVDYAAKTVTPTLEASDGTDLSQAAFAYSVDDQSVITIDQNGAFTVVGAGTAKVTVIASLGGGKVAEAVCDIVVYSVEVEKPVPVPTVYTLELKIDETNENKLVYELTANPSSDIPEGVTYEFTVTQDETSPAIRFDEATLTFEKIADGTANITVVAKFDGKVIATADMEITVTASDLSTPPTE